MFFVCFQSDCNDKQKQIESWITVMIVSVHKELPQTILRHLRWIMQKVRSLESVYGGWKGGGGGGGCWSVVV